VGQNPPAGTLIDYYLPREPNGAVTIEILDSSGNVVRHLSSTHGTTKEQPPEWPDQVHPEETLPARRGMNRFVWDIRYDAPVAIPDAFYAGLPPRGPIVLPGVYTVRLTYAGQMQTAPLTIAPDPRDAEGSLEGLRQKFTLSMQVYHDQDALHRAVNDIRAVKRDVAAALAKSSGPRGTALTNEGNALTRQASQIEGLLMQVNIKGSEANLNFPGMLNEQIYSFAGLLDDADTAPNQQETDTYAALHARLAEQLTAWGELKKQRVTAFCAQARHADISDLPMCP
jgi:hypothetical protein